MIKRINNVYYIFNKNGTKKLGPLEGYSIEKYGEIKAYELARKRLGIIEYFKNKNKKIIRSMR